MRIHPISSIVTLSLQSCSPPHSHTGQNAMKMSLTINLTGNGDLAVEKIKNT